MLRCYQDVIFVNLQKIFKIKSWQNPILAHFGCILAHCAPMPPNWKILLRHHYPLPFLFMQFAHEYYVVAFKNQKDVKAIQYCSLENQKSANAIDFVQQKLLSGYWQNNVKQHSCPLALNWRHIAACEKEIKVAHLKAPSKNMWSLWCKHWQRDVGPGCYSVSIVLADTDITSSCPFACLAKRT